MMIYVHNWARILIVLLLFYPAFALAEGSDNFRSIGAYDNLQIDADQIAYGSENLDLEGINVMQPEMTVSRDQTSHNRGIPAASSGVVAIDNGLGYILNAQDHNGSWNNRSLDTFYALMVANELLGIQSQEYVEGRDWVLGQWYTAVALAARRLDILSESNIDVEAEVESVMKEMNEIDGGYGYSREYESDVVSSSTVLDLISSTGYSDPMPEPDETLTSVLIYLVESQNQDGGWGEVIGTPSGIWPTVEALLALEPYQSHRVSSNPIGSVLMGDVASDALAYLQNMQQADGTWNRNLLDTALAFRVLTRYGIDMDYEQESLAYLLREQEVDGSWENGSVYVTARVLLALIDANLSRPDLAITAARVHPNSGPLQTNALAVSFQLTIENQGAVAVTDGVLNLFVDDYAITSIDLATLPNGFNVAPGQTENMQVNFGPDFTVRIAGDIEMRWYIETSNELDYEDNWITHAENVSADPVGVPAIPTYSVAYADVDSNNRPAVHYRWANKSDPNRLEYAILYRLQGVPDWTALTLGNNNTFGVTVGGIFTEGEIYEVQPGVAYDDGSGLVVRHLQSEYSTVQVSNNPGLYTSSAEGYVTLDHDVVEGVNIDGYDIVDVQSDAQGNFVFTSMPNGSNILRIDETSLYETSLSKVATLTGVASSGTRLFTRLKEDTTPPTINTVMIIGENDMVFENASTKNIYVSGSDNEEIKEADVVLVQPDGTRNYLGSATFSRGAIFSILSWDVPEALTGSGFYIEAVLQDYQENISSVASYGPFEIVQAPIDPTITLINATSALVDRSVVLQWVDEDPDSDAVVSLYYDNDNQGFDGLLITGGISEDAALDQYTWRTADVPNGVYYVYATISDGQAISRVYMAEPITIRHADIRKLPGDIRIKPAVLRYPEVSRS